MRPNLNLFKPAALGLLLALGLTHPVHAFQHPGIPLTVADLNTLKSNLTVEPWATGWQALQSDSHSSTNYVMQGPFGRVDRNADVNLNQWKNDMQAVWNLSRMWYFTGNTNYAQKARDIWIPWCNTLTNFGGAEMYLSLGDYAYRAIGGVDLLRGTWPGWTAADTTTSQNHFTSRWLPWSPVPNPLRSANQGVEQLIFTVGIAYFNDDTNLVNQCLQAFRADVNGGLADSLPSGAVGDSGRDQGHAYGQLLHLGWCAEVFWKQGVDVYSDLDNRLLACGEFYSRYNLGVETPWMPFGTKYDYYWTGHGGAPMSSEQPPDFLNLVHGAYVVRQGMSAPYLQQYRATRAETADSFVYRKSADTSTAAPPAALTSPAPSASVTTGFLNSDIGGATPAGSANYSNGTWTVTGGGSDIWGNSDSFHFTYKLLTNDFTFIAKVTSLQATHVSAKAAIEMRDSLSATATRRIHFGYIPGSTVPMIESHQRGYTANSHNDPDEVTHDGPTNMLPHWMKIQRIGSRITVFHSPDGGSWTPLQHSEYASWTNTAYVGLGVCSRVNGTLTTATFTDVRITGGDGGEAAKIPAAPVYVYASPDAGLATVRWLESFGATSYIVKRATDSGGPYTNIVTGLTNTSYVDTGLTVDQTYYYVVSATNSVGESTNSIEESITIPPPPDASFYTNSIGYWQTAANWTNVPIAAGNNLVFDSLSSVNTNDFPSGTPFGTMNFANCNVTICGSNSASRYVFSHITNSGTVTLTNFIAAFANGSTLTATAGSLSFRTPISNGAGNTLTLQPGGGAINLLATVTNLGTLILNNSGQQNLNSLITGTGQVLRNGPGLVGFQSGSGGFGGTLVINGHATQAGRVQMEPGAGLSGFSSVTLNDNIPSSIFNAGGLRTIYGHNVAVNFPSLVISDGSTNVVNQSNPGTATYNGTWTGGGTLQILNGFGPTFNLAANMTNFTGTLVLGCTGGSSDGFSLQNTSAIGLPNATVWLWNGQGSNSAAAGTLQWNPSTTTSAVIPIGALWNTNSNPGTTNYLSNAKSGTTATYQIGGLNTDSVFGGIIQNGSGTTAIRKVGTGTLAFTAANSYTGGTVISNGTLLANNPSGSGTGTGAVTVGGGKLGGGGFIGGAVTVQFGGTLAPGNSLGTLTVSNTVTLQAGSSTVMEINRTNALTSDRLVANSIIGGGTLTVTNIGPVNYVAGDTFTLFNSPVIGFSTVNLPPLPFGKIWNNCVPVDGTLVVAAVNTTPTNLVSIVVGNQLQLSWPADHTGWRLQTQTNSLNAGLGTNWFNVMGTDATNQVSIPIGAESGSVFFRLVYP